MTVSAASVNLPTSIELGWAPGGEFGLAELTRLALRRPIESIEVSVPSEDDRSSGTGGLANASRLNSVLQKLPSAEAWVVLKDVQQDEAYSAHVDRLFQIILRNLGIDLQETSTRRCHVFISSDGAHTPLHADDCHGVLVQVSGCKEITIYDMGRDYFSPRLARLSAKSARVFELPANHRFSEERHVLRPGAALTIPWNWPHEVTTPLNSRSVSLNVSFETKQTRHSARAAVTNDLLLHAGHKPQAIGVNKNHDTAKALIGSALDRMGLLSLIERHKQIGEDLAR